MTPACIADPLCDGAEIITLVTGMSLPRGIAVDETSGYWTNRGDGTVRRCASEGCGGVPEIVAKDQGEPFGIVLDATFVYWTNVGDGRVMRIAK